MLLMARFVGTKLVCSYDSCHNPIVCASGCRNQYIMFQHGRVDCYLKCSFTWLNNFKTFLKPLEKEETSPVEELQSEETAISDFSSGENVGPLALPVGRAR